MEDEREFCYEVDEEINLNELLMSVIKNIKIAIYLLILFSII